MAEWAMTSLSTKDRFHVGQWVFTPDGATSTLFYGLQEIAILPTNPALYWRGIGGVRDDDGDGISPENFPQCAHG